MTIEAVERYKEYVAKYPNKTRNEISKAIGVAYATLIKYEERGLIVLPPKMTKHEAGLKRKEGFGKFVINKNKVQK